MTVFIDSNIPMYVAGRSHPNRRPARRFLAKVQSREIAACTSAEVLQEILYRYTALRRRDLAGAVYNLFVEICPVILDITLSDTDRALDLIQKVEDLSARDALHAAVMLNNGVDQIATFDRDFNRVPGIRCLDLNPV